MPPRVRRPARPVPSGGLPETFREGGGSRFEEPRERAASGPSPRAACPQRWSAGDLQGGRRIEVRGSSRACRLGSVDPRGLSPAVVCQRPPGREEDRDSRIGARGSSRACLLGSVDPRGLSPAVVCRRPPGREEDRGSRNLQGGRRTKGPKRWKAHPPTAIETADARNSVAIVESVRPKQRTMGYLGMQCIA